MKVALGTLKDKGEELVTFLEPRVGTKPELSGDTIEIDEGSMKEGLKTRQVKTYIKRFLFTNGVRRNYRVFVEGKELTLQEIELGEEEEEEKKEKVVEKIDKAEKVEEERKEEPVSPKEASTENAPAPEKVKAKPGEEKTKSARKKKTKTEKKKD